MQVRAARGACCERFGVSREDLASDPRPKAGRNPGQKSSCTVDRCARHLFAVPHQCILRSEHGRKPERTGRTGTDRIGSEAGEWDTLQHIVRPVQVCTGLHRSAVRASINEILLALSAGLRASRNELITLSDLLIAGVAAAALALLGSSPCAGGGVHSPPHRQDDGHGWTGAASAPFARHRKPVLRRRSLQLPRPTCGQSTLGVLVAARVLQVGRACALRVELLWSRMCKPAGSLSFLSPRGRPCAGALMNMPGSQS